MRKVGDTGLQNTVGKRGWKAQFLFYLCNKWQVQMEWQKQFLAYWAKAQISVMSQAQISVMSQTCKGTKFNHVKTRFLFCFQCYSNEHTGTGTMFNNATKYVISKSSFSNVTSKGIVFSVIKSACFNYFFFFYYPTNTY